MWVNKQGDILMVFEVYSHFIYRSDLKLFCLFQGITLGFYWCTQSRKWTSTTPLVNLTPNLTCKIDWRHLHCSQWVLHALKQLVCKSGKASF